MPYCIIDKASKTLLVYIKLGVLFFVFVCLLFFFRVYFRFWQVLIAGLSTFDDKFLTCELSLLSSRRPLSQAITLRYFTSTKPSLRRPFSKRRKPERSLVLKGKSTTGAYIRAPNASFSGMQLKAQSIFDCHARSFAQACGTPALNKPNCQSTLPSSKGALDTPHKNSPTSSPSRSNGKCGHERLVLQFLRQSARCGRALHALGRRTPGAVATAGDRGVQLASTQQPNDGRDVEARR